MKVQSLMSTDPVACSPGDTLDVAGWRMWDRDIGVVPVVDEERRVVGVVTDRDLAMATVLRARAPSQLRVADTMTSNVATCSPEDDIARAEEVMCIHQVRRLPVVDDDGRLVGMLSLNDLAQNLSRRKVPGIPAADLARTLQTVSRPRHAVAQLTDQESAPAAK